MSNKSPEEKEIKRLRKLAGIVYAGLGGECHLPDKWLDALYSASEGLKFSTKGLLPFTMKDLARPDDIRAKGWTVAVHNDYRLDGVAHTFWLFTKDGLAVKGEGKSDEEALNIVRKQIKALSK